MKGEKNAFEKNDPVTLSNFRRVTRRAGLIAKRFWSHRGQNHRACAEEATAKPG